MVEGTHCDQLTHDGNMEVEIDERVDRQVVKFRMEGGLTGSRMLSGMGGGCASGRVGRVE